MESPIAACVLVMVADRVLVVRRPDGLHGLPGGHIEPGETPLDAAVRELREETGLSVARWELEPFFGPSERFPECITYVLRHMPSVAALEGIRGSHEGEPEWATLRELFSASSRFPEYNECVVSHLLGLNEWP